MEEIGLSLQILKLALEIFKDERKDRFLKLYNKLEKDYQNEKDKGKANWSDLTLVNIVRDRKRIYKLVVAESIKK